MSAFTDSSRPGRANICPWRPAGLLYLAALLAGLGAGLWPETLWPALANTDAAPLPVLQTLAVAQLIFIMLVYPIVLLKRFGPGRGHLAREKWHGHLARESGTGILPVKRLAHGQDAHATIGTRRPYWRPVLAESAMFMVLAVPFYLPAAFLADATPADVLRHMICIASFLPLAWLAGAHFARPRRGAWAVTLALLAATLGMPAACYVAAEFLTPTLAYWLSCATPALLAWESAASQGASVLPQPLWAWLGWLAVAAVAVAIGAMIPPPAVARASRP